MNPLAIVTFCKESWNELRQVSWLTVPQVVASTVLVIILASIVAMYIFGVDFLLKQIIGVFLI